MDKVPQRHRDTDKAAVPPCCTEEIKLTPLPFFKKETLPKYKLPRRNFVHVHSKGGLRRFEVIAK